MAYNQKYTVVTGGSGFIGSCLIRELNNKGIEKILVVDELLSDNRWMNLLQKRYGSYLHKSNLLSWLQGKEAEIESIYHLGACSSTLESDVDYLMENNYNYTRSLIEYSVKHRIPILIASSAATYGDGSKGFSDDHMLLDTLMPLNAYGFSKHAIDLWLLREGLLHQVTSVKYFNVFGPNEWHKGRMASRVLAMVDEVEKKGYIELFASNHPEYQDGEQRRDFLYVKDAVRITADLLCKKQYGVFNIGSGVASTWNNFAVAVFKALQLQPDIRYIPMPHDLEGKYQYYTQASIEKLVAIYGEKVCHYTLIESIQEYIQHHILTNRRW